MGRVEAKSPRGPLCNGLEYYEGNKKSTLFHRQCKRDEEEGGGDDKKKRRWLVTFLVAVTGHRKNKTGCCNMVYV